MLYCFVCGFSFGFVEVIMMAVFLEPLPASKEETFDSVSGLNVKQHGNS
jgi:hypothetical protein